MIDESFSDTYAIFSTPFGVSPREGYDAIVYNAGVGMIYYGPTAEIPHSTFKLRPDEAVRLNDKLTWYFRCAGGMSEITVYRIRPEVEFKRGV